METSIFIILTGQVFSTTALALHLNWQDWLEGNSNHRANFNAIKAFTDKIDYNQILIPGNDYGSGFDFNKTVATYWLKETTNNKIYGWTKNLSNNWTTESYPILVSNNVSATYLQDIQNLMTFTPPGVSFDIPSGHY